MNNMRNSDVIEQFIYNMRSKYLYTNDSALKGSLVQNGSKPNASIAFKKPYEVIKNER
ncbi:MAG: hypothetical protein WA144_06935 [Candidatus Methanoperedens sp.]